MIERYFRLLPDSLATYQEWRQLIVRHAVVGAQAHDARLIASMNAYGISHLLTFNVEHFRRYQGITVIEPQHVRFTQLSRPVLERTRFGQPKREKLAFSR
jgi:hypothetical protein